MKRQQPPERTSASASDQTFSFFLLFGREADVQEVAKGLFFNFISFIASCSSKNPDKNNFRLP